MKYDRHLLVGALSASLVLAMGPLSVDAAWWNFGQRAGAAIVGSSSEPPVVLAQASQGAAERFNRIEAQMRTLTGQIEELSFQVRQLQGQLKLMQEDNEFRFRDLENGASPAPRSETPANLAALAPPTLPPPSAVRVSEPIGNIADQGLPPAQGVPLGGPGLPPSSLGTLTLDGPPAKFSDQPLDLTAPLPLASGTGGPDLAMTGPTGDPYSDYQRAYSSILSGDYKTAEVGLRQFLVAYPEDARAPDAQYWLGESFFSRAQFREAANEFLAAYKSFPKSSRAPDSLLKLGLSLAGLGEREAACSTFAAVLKQFPDASSALRQRVDFEQASASC